MSVEKKELEHFYDVFMRVPSRPVVLNLSHLAAHFASQKFAGTPKTRNLLQITSSQNFCFTLNLCTICTIIVKSLLTNTSVQLINADFLLCISIFVLK